VAGVQASCIRDRMRGMTGDAVSSRRGHAGGLRYDPTAAAPGLFAGLAIMPSTSFAAAAVAWSGDGRVRAARKSDFRTSVVASRAR